MSDEDWLSVSAMNLISAVRLDRALIPGMIARGSGAIIHISAVISRVPAAKLHPCSAGERSAEPLRKGLSTELAAHGGASEHGAPGPGRDRPHDHLPDPARSGGRARHRVVAELLGNGHTVLALARSAQALQESGAQLLREALAHLDVLRAGPPSPTA